MTPRNPAYRLWRRRQTYDDRERGRRWFGFAIPNRTAIERLCALGPLLEVGAGLGYWARLIHEAGGDIVATDLEPAAGASIWEGRGLWHPVIAMDGARAVRRWRKRTLLMVWPHFKGTWDAETLSAYKGERFVFVGEEEDGCTGSQRLHDLLHRNWEIEEEINIPQWMYVHDRLVVYHRRA